MAVEIPNIPFAHSQGKKTPVEVVRLSELRARETDLPIFAPKRPDFYVLMFVTEGAGSHWIDFMRHALRPGDVLQVRPDQVHAFDADSNHEALLLLFRPEMVPASHVERLAIHLSQPVHLASRDFKLLIQVLDFLQQIERMPAHIRLTSMAAGLLQAIIAGLDEWYAREHSLSANPGHQRALELVHRFEQLLHHQVGRQSLVACAGQLHVTTRTLSRACQQIRGTSPKKLIDRNLALEAKRQLILGNATGEEIGYDLGFSEASNFVKFFKRIVGQTPEAFRLQQRRDE
ncbi:helix-turn-helix domain-containing protein [Synoicihabitans lomoniglobus]|uniref:AraC family transcriptional regulator n=1 Tax=Synoicihabitans lomoniglobus TaxID=2909285 RepID=A0AAF0CN28_9BACT|nr:AraC family transcriptional regulator [Opitutaceae bacterium LMO-M01]WED64086.1 AraC family transcriptional regulator [Opitutaceae bacterium LMO-M01]